MRWLEGYQSIPALISHHAPNSSIHSTNILHPYDMPGTILGPGNTGEIKTKMPGLTELTSTW